MPGQNVKAIAYTFILLNNDEKWSENELLLYEQKCRKMGKNEGYRQHFYFAQKMKEKVKN